MCRAQQEGPDVSAPGMEMIPGLLRMPPSLGENPPDALLPIAPFIRALADRLDKARLRWAILRNAEGLPWHTRYDLDVLVDPDHQEQFLRIVESCAAETGWQVAGRMGKRHYACLMLLKGSVEKGLTFLPLDVFSSLEHRGLRYLDTREVLGKRLRNPNGFWTLPAGLQAAIAVLKELLPHRHLKEPALQSAQALAVSDPDGFRRALEAAVGAALGGRLAAMVQSGTGSLSAEEDRALRSELRRRNPSWILAHADAARLNLLHLFRPSLGFVVCLAGADGSGKTTLAQGLAADTFKRPFKACRYVHGNIGVLPRFRDMRAGLRRWAGLKTPPAAEAAPAKVLQGMMEPLPPWKSILLATYYAFDLLLARPLVRLWRGQWALVVMDRSFYDYYYQLGHRRCPPRVLDVLSRLVPKPDLLLCIEGDAEQIHARKAELIVEEIEAEQSILRGLADRLPFAHRLDGSAGIEAMVAAGRDKILGLLPGSERSRSAPWCCGELAGRPWLAYAAGTRSQRMRALDLFPRVTLKRRVFHAGIRGLAALRADSAFCSLRDSAGDLLSRAEHAGLLDEIARAIGSAPEDWLLVWPSRPERRRLYLVFRAAATGRIGVVKIGADDFNRRQFQNEAGSLRRLAGLAHPFAIPAVLFEHDLDDERYLLALGGFPSHLRSMSAAQASHRSASVIEHLASLRFAHGDLGPGNMLVDDGGGLFLFDWENASADAPARVDEIGFWLSLRQGRALRAPRGQVEALRRDFRGLPEAELLAALDFLRARDNLAATRLLETWE
jgi:hypothetical protein